MSGGNITREDIRHEDIVDAVEQASDGLTSIIFTGKTVVSTTSSSKVVVLSGVDLLRDPEIIEELDIVILAGTTGADGAYTVDQRIDSTSFSVKEAIADSTGGTCEVRNPPGARKVGVNSGSMVYSSADNVQEVLEDLDGAITGGGGLTPAAHRALDQLVHNVAEDSYEEYTYSGNQVTSIVVWEDNTKAKKIREELFTYSGNKVTQIVTKHYDSGGSLVETLTEDFTYSGNKVDYIDRSLT